MNKNGINNAIQMKKNKILLITYLIFPIICFSQIKKSSDVFKTVNGKNYRVGKVVMDSKILDYTVYIYKNRGGKDYRVGKVVNGKVYEITRNGSLKQVMTSEDEKGTNLYFVRNGSIIGKGSWWKNKIYKVTGYNIWDGYMLEEVGKFDGAGQNKALGAAFLLLF